MFRKFLPESPIDVKYYSIVFDVNGIPPPGAMNLFVTFEEILWPPTHGKSDKSDNYYFLPKVDQI